MHLYSHRSWMRMTKCKEERWTPLLQPPRAILARPHLLNDSPPTSFPASSPFTLTSNSPPLQPHASPWPWCNDRPLNYHHRLIAADCNCCELFRLCWNCSQNGREREAERERYCRSNKLHTSPTWSISLFQKQQLWSLTVPINEAEQGNNIRLPCAVVQTHQHNTESLLSLLYVK